MQKKCLFVILLLGFINTPVISDMAGTGAFPSDKSQNAKIIIVDHLDRTVEVLKNPKRIVSLHPIATQIIYLLNAQDNLISFDNMSSACKWVHKIDPDWASREILTFGDVPPNIEAIAAINPDIVIQGAYFPGQVDQVEKVAAVVSFDFHLRSAVDAIELIGKVIGKEKRAHELIEYLNNKTKEITAITSLIAREHRPTVFYQTYQSSSDGNFVLNICGNKAYQHGLIEKAGGINLGENYPVIWQSVDKELILYWEPDVMFIRPPVRAKKNLTIKDLESNPVLNKLMLFKNKRFYIAPDGEFSSTVNAPEGIIGLQFMAKKLHPAKFAWLNLENEVKEFYSKWYNYRLSDQEVNQILNP